jgi:hypothetical protein
MVMPPEITCCNDVDFSQSLIHQFHAASKFCIGINSIAFQEELPQEILHCCLWEMSMAHV